ncbi:WXG100 family type VII secretion target [Nonomuraea cavernae]|uniref:WXG100 family type VII secretion target n=1 Tax=Nonomuraea cavernae TaxID=2045107 RepID=UPI003402D6F7
MADKQTHWIKKQCMNGDLDDDGRSVAEIKNFIKALDPVATETASTSYKDASARLVKTLEEIDKVSVELGKIWEGKASVEAQKALRLLHDTIVNLSDGLEKMSKPLASLSDTIREHQDFVNSNSFAWSQEWSGSWDDSTPGWFKTIDKGVEWGSQDELAGQHLRAFTNDLAKIHQQIPDTVEKNLPSITAPALPTPTYKPVDLGDTPKYPKNGPQDTNPYGNNPNGNNPNPYDNNPNGNNPSVTNPNVTDPNATDPNATDPNATDPNATDPNATNPNVTDPNGNGPGNTDNVNGNIPGTDQPGIDPASLNPDGTNGSANPNGTDPRSTGLSDYQPPKLDTAPISTIGPNSSTSPTTILPAGNPSATAVPGGGIPGTGTNVGTNLPVNMNGSTSLRAGGNMTGMNGMGMPFMPMGGMGAGGGEERTSESSTWLVEDDDVWGGPAKEVVDDTIR